MKPKRVLTRLATILTELKGYLRYKMMTSKMRRKVMVRSQVI